MVDALECAVAIRARHYDRNAGAAGNIRGAEAAAAHRHQPWRHVESGPGGAEDTETVSILPHDCRSWPELVASSYRTRCSTMSATRLRSGSCPGRTAIEEHRRGGGCLRRMPDDRAPPCVDDRTGTRAPAVAVLPFRNMSGDPAQEYFADGITEDLIGAVRVALVSGHRPHSTCVQGASRRRHTGRRAKPGARYVVEGSVQRAGDRVRIGAQLIDAGSAVHLGAELRPAPGRRPSFRTRDHAGDRRRDRAAVDARRATASPAQAAGESRQLGPEPAGAFRTSAPERPGHCGRPAAHSRRTFKPTSSYAQSLLALTRFQVRSPDGRRILRVQIASTTQGPPRRRSRSTIG